MFGKELVLFSLTKSRTWLFVLPLEIVNCSNYDLLLEMEMVDAVALLKHHGKTPDELSLRANSIKSSRTLVTDVLPHVKKDHDDPHRTLHEIFSEVDRCFRSQDVHHTPDLVLNLPIVHSTIIIDVQPSTKKIPPPVMKKSEKTRQLIQRLGLMSLSSSSKVTEV